MENLGYVAENTYTYSKQNFLQHNISNVIIYVANDNKIHPVPLETSTIGFLLAFRINCLILPHISVYK